jgi:acyl carrier protein
VNKDIYKLVCSKITAAYDQDKTIPEFYETTRLSDLQLDSLSLLEVIFELESHFNITIEDHRLAGMRTVADMSRAVESALKAMQ